MTSTCQCCGSTVTREQLVAHMDRLLPEILDDLEQGRWYVDDLPTELRWRLVMFLRGATKDGT